MTKLTANTHGYEFEILPNIVIQYDATMISGMIHIDSSVVIVKATNKEESDRANGELWRLYDDEHSFKPAIAKHFRSIN